MIKCVKACHKTGTELIRDIGCIEPFIDGVWLWPSRCESFV